MEILLNNSYKNLYNLVNKKAKYQKVLVIYDDFVSNLEINELYLTIKELCIFNKMEISNINEKEIFNGYKMLIFFCSGISLLKLNLNREEFINVYLLQDNNLLPCFVNNVNLLTKESYILIENPVIDNNLLSSFYFNNFINYLDCILNFKPSFIETDFKYELTLNSVTDAFNLLDETYKFTDLNIIKDSNINYNEISLLHLIIVDAFLILFSAIKNKQSSLVDVYKVAKNNTKLIEKLYANYNNKTIYNSIILNYNFLNNFTTKTKKNILKNIYLNSDIDYSKLDESILKIKNYLKNCDNFLNYLYLYDIFGN